MRVLKSEIFIFYGYIIIISTKILQANSIHDGFALSVSTCIVLEIIRITIHFLKK